MTSPELETCRFDGIASDQINSPLAPLCLIRTSPTIATPLISHQSRQQRPALRVRSPYHQQQSLRRHLSSTATPEFDHGCSLAPKAKRIRLGELWPQGEPSCQRLHPCARAPEKSFGPLLKVRVQPLPSLSHGRWTPPKLVPPNRSFGKVDQLSSRSDRRPSGSKTHELRHRGGIGAGALWFHQRVLSGGAEPVSRSSRARQATTPTCSFGL